MISIRNLTKFCHDVRQISPRCQDLFVTLAIGFNPSSGLTYILRFSNHATNSTTASRDAWSKVEREPSSNWSAEGRSDPDGGWTQLSEGKIRTDQAGIGAATCRVGSNYPPPPKKKKGKNRQLIHHFEAMNHVESMRELPMRNPKTSQLTTQSQKRTNYPRIGERVHGSG